MQVEKYFKLTGWSKLVLHSSVSAFALESQPSAVDTWAALKSSTSTSREDLIYKSVPIYVIQPLRRNRLGLGTNKIRRFSASSRKVPVPRGIECIREEPNKLLKPEKMGAVQVIELHIPAALSVNEEVSGQLHISRSDKYN